MAVEEANATGYGSDRALGGKFEAGLELG